MRLVGKKIETTTDSFAAMVRENCLLVDKTLMIKDFIEGQKVSLITRPRRFGKTLNMSMLHHFFAAEAYGEKTADLFKGFAIAEAVDQAGIGYIEKYQGQYPVIFITLKDVKEPLGHDKKEPASQAISKIRVLIKELYRQHTHLLNSDKIDEDDKKEFKRYCGGETNNQELEGALRFLSEFLYKAYEKKVIILIDEYDTPLSSAYEHGYIDELSDFMRNLFSAALKSNPYLEKGLMTGILRVSQNSMLSGLNNLETYTLLNEAYQQYFGFTEDEVLELIGELSVTEELENIRSYYNGYKIGKQVIYNPWSLMNYFKDKELRPYWILTSNDKLLKKVLLNSSDVVKEQLGQLIVGDAIKVAVNLNLRYEDLMEDPSTLWTLLLFCGYLKAENITSAGSRFFCQIKIPNEEILTQYTEVFSDRLRTDLGLSTYDSFLRDLVEGRIRQFIENLRGYLLGCTSAKDFNSESNYHTFVLGLLSGLTTSHYLFSNKECGLGFPDVVLISKDKKSTQGIILEFKYVSFKDKQAGAHKDIAQLAAATQACVVTALKQIELRGYDFTFSAHPHIKEVIKIGIAFANRFVAAGSISTTVKPGGALALEAFEEKEITFYEDRPYL